jgi:hypothetical protein
MNAEIANDAPLKIGGWVFGAITSTQVAKNRT